MASHGNELCFSKQVASGQIIFEDLTYPQVFECYQLLAREKQIWQEVQNPKDLSVEDLVDMDKRFPVDALFPSCNAQVVTAFKAVMVLREDREHALSIKTFLRLMEHIRKLHPASSLA